MRSTGIVRKIDELGRIVLPKETRDIFGWKKGTPIEFFSEGDTIILRSYIPGCTFCGSVNDLERHKGMLLCQGCIDDIKNNF